MGLWGGGGLIITNDYIYVAGQHGGGRSSVFTLYFRFFLTQILFVICLAYKLGDMLSYNTHIEEGRN